jgi:hypothetical protein
MRQTPALAAALLLAGVAAPALAQPASPAPAVAAQVRETAGCAAVFMVAGQMASNPQVVGSDPLAGALGSMFGRTFSQKGRALYARAAEQARRDRAPPEAVFEAGVNYLMEQYASARARAPGGAQVDATTEAARLLERCVTAFPDPVVDY